MAVWDTCDSRWLQPQAFFTVLLNGCPEIKVQVCVYVHARLHPNSAPRCEQGFYVRSLQPGHSTQNKMPRGTEEAVESWVGAELQSRQEPFSLSSLGILHQD